MTRHHTTAATEHTPPSGDLVMPDAGSFRTPDLADGSGPPIGRAIGIDYEKWAVALIDLTGDAARIASARLRLKGKGYQKVEGQPVVSGYAAAEVWVLPRQMHEARLAARHQRIVAAVASGEMTEFALPRETVSRGR